MDRKTFMAHLREMEQAIDHTQPLADYAGNIDAIHSLVTLQISAQRIIADVDALLSEKARVLR